MYIELEETIKGKLYNGRQFVCYDTKTSGLEFKQFQEEHGLEFLKSYQLIDKCKNRTLWEPQGSIGITTDKR